MYSLQGYSFPHRAMSDVQAQSYFAKYIEAENQLGADYIRDSVAFKTHTALPWVRDICLLPSVLDVIETVLGPNILCFSSTFFVKQPRLGQYVSMHEDSLYFDPTEPDNVASIWLALNGSNKTTGCLEYVSESHLHDYNHVYNLDYNNLLPRGQTVEGYYSTVHAELDAGEFSMHHIKLLHRSGPNQSSQYRVGVVARYCKPSCRIQMFSSPSAITARGTNTNTDYWQEDYIPVEDYDIAGIDYIRYTMNKDFKNESTS